MSNVERRTADPALGQWVRQAREDADHRELEVPTTRKDTPAFLGPDSLGDDDSRQTIDNSSGVRVTEKKPPCVAQRRDAVPDPACKRRGR